MFHGFPQTASLTGGDKVAISPLPEILAASKRLVVPWAGEVVEGREGKQPGLRVEPTAQRDLCPPWLAGCCLPKGEVFGATCRNVGSKGGCPSMGSRVMAMAALSGQGFCGTGVWWQGGPRAAQQPMGGQLRLQQPIGAWGCLDGHGDLG